MDHMGKKNGKDMQFVLPPFFPWSKLLNKTQESRNVFLILSQVERG